MKNFYLLFVSISLTMFTFSQGDDCANALNIGALPNPANCGIPPSQDGSGTDVVNNLTNVGAIAENPYTSILDCQGGTADQATPAADVWVTFVGSAQVLDITITSGLGGVNVAIYQGTTCGALTPIFCSISNNGSMAETFNSIVPGSQYFMQISGEDETDTAPFTLTLNNYEDCSQCAQDLTLSATPPPVNGIYQPGTTVEFCLNVGGFTQISAHWLHGISPLDFGPGWVAGSLVGTGVTGSDVNWIWVDNNTVPQAGYYVDSDADGAVTDNYGDNGVVNVEACWQMTTVSEVNCVNGASAGLNVETYSDGETGSYTSGSCTGDPVTPFNAIVSCCDFPLTAFVNPSCDNIADGSASATGQGGTAPYDYSWEDASGAVVSTDNNLADGVASSATGLLNGTYTVTVTDDNGCEKIVDITIAGPVCPPCILTGITANASITCPSATYSTTGTLTFSDAPASGTLTVSDCNGNNQVFNAPFTSPQNYSLTGQTADGLACDITAVFSADAACTITANPTAPICPCSITNFTAVVGNCVAATDSYSMSGTVTFDMPPTTGTLTITVDNGTSTYDTIINAADFTSPLNFSISGIPSDESGSTITAIFSADAACTSALAYTAPQSCACDAEIGTFSTSDDNATNTDYVLCFGDNFNYQSNGDYTPPADLGNGDPYNPGIAYLIYSCPPTPGVEPNADPCLEGIAIDGTGALLFNDANDLFYINGFPAGTFTDNIIYYVPITMYDIAGNLYSNVIAPNPTCYDLGPTVPVQYLPEIKIIDAEDCQAGSITTTIEGGLPELDGSNFNIVPGSLTPANASFDNTSAANLGTITISGLTNGQAYQYSIVDGNGCPVVISGTFIGTEDPGFSYNNYVICTAGTDPAVTVTGDAGSFSFTATSGGPTLSLNTTTGAVDASASDPGTYDITYTTNDATCFSDSTVTMTINLTPIVDPELDQTVCANSAFAAINFTGTAGATYTWTNSNTAIGIGANGSGDISSFTGTNATSAPISATITVTPTLGTCVGTPTTFDLIVNPMPVVNAGTDQTVCTPNAVTLTATNPNGAVISWDNGVTNGVAFNPAVGTITYTVTANLAGCISTDVVNVTVNPLPNIDAGLPQTVCENTNTTLTATNPDGATLSWDNGVNNGISFTPPVGTTTYTVTATLLTCVSTDVVDITVNPLPVFTVAGTDPTTCGGNDGFITISGLNASTSYQVTYNDGAVQGPAAMNSDAGGDIVITGLSAGNYTDFVASLLGCATTDNTIINLVDPSAPTVDAGLPQTVCEPSAVTLTATNPDGAIITWDNGVTDATAFNPAVGTLTYTVTADLAGCISTDVVDVTVNPLPVVDAGVNIIICEGIDTMLTATNPDGAIITWDNGVTDATSFTPPVGATTTYTVTADLLTCISTDVVDITVNPLPVFTVAGTDPTTCGGNDGFITISGLNASTTYQITYNNGAVQGPAAMNSDAGGDIVITGLPAGNYTDFVASLLGCPTTDNTIINLVDPSAPTVDAGLPQTVCEPSAVTLTATNPDGATISWDNGVTDATAFNPAVGTLTYTVTANLLGCISTDVVNVTVNPLPVVDAGVNIIICEGIDTMLTATNPDGAIISWDNGVTDATSFTPPVGATTTYTVTADLLTCISTDVVDITVNPLPVFTVAGTDPTTCGGNDGFITISGLNASTTYQITYNNGAVQGPAAMNSDAGGDIVITGLSAGNYTDFVASLLGCPTTDNTVINLVDPSAPTVDAGLPQTVCEPSAVTLTATNPDGAIITWDNGVTDATAFNPAVGTLTYTVTADLAGCISTDVVDVTVNPLPTVVAGTNQTVCENTAVTLIANNPDGAIISWDNGVTNLVAFNPAVGSLTYTVTADLAGCISTDVVDVTVNPLPVFAVAGTSPTSCGGNDGFITLSGLDASTTYNITYSDGNTQGPTAMNSDAGGNIVITGLSAGNYTDFVVTILGCSTSDNTIINLVDPSAPTVDAGLPQTVCEPSAVTLTATNPDGATISWDNGVTDATAFNPAVGTLTYTVTANLLGCISTDVVDVTVNPLPVVNAGTNQTICDGEIVNLTATNPNAATISWDNGITDGLDFTPAVGTLTYTVTADLLGCISTDDVDITVNPLGNPGFSYPLYSYCSAEADPTANIDVAGGNFSFTATSGGPNLAIDLTTGLIDLDASNPGSYNITYTTVGTCPQDSTIVMNIAATPTVNPVVDQTVCHNQNFILINFTGSAGSVFDWTNDNSSIGLGVAGNGNILSFTGTNTTLTPQTGIIVVTPSAGSCVGPTTTFNLTVNPLDNPGFNFPLTSFCTTDANPTPTIDVVGGTFTSFTTSGSGTIDIDPATGEINLVNSNAGSYNITYTTAGPDCPQDSTINVIINLTPVVNSVIDQLVCEGGSFLTVDFTGTANPTFTWTNDNTNIGLAASGNGDILPFTTTSAGGLEISNITVTPSTATCVGADSTFILSVNPSDNPGFNYTSYNYCTGDLVDPTANIDVAGGTFTYVALTGGPNLVIDAGTGLIDLDLSNEGNYDITYTTGGPCVQDSTVNLTINFTPTVNPLLDQTICHGTNFNPSVFTGTNGVLTTTYDWTNDDTSIGLAANGSGDIATFVGTNVSNNQTTGLITVTPSTSECIGTPTSFNLIVDPLDDPSFEYVDGLTYCATGSIDPSVNITGTTGGTFDFVINNGGPTLVFDTNTGGIDLSASDVGSYDITYTTNAACPQTSTLTLVITNAPVADFTSGTYCANDVDPLPTYINNGSGGLFTASPAGLVINGANGLVDLDASTAGTYTITNTIDLTSQGCALATATDDITINEIPTAVISGSTTLCASDPLPDVQVDFTNTANGPFDLTYSFNGANQTINSGNPYIINGAQFGNYNLISVTDANGCTNNAVGNVAIDSFPTPIVNTLPLYEVCEGSDLVIENFAGTPVGNIYNWTLTSGTDIGFGENGSGNIGSFTSTNPQSVTVEVIPTSTDGCIGTPTSFNINVNPLPVVDFTADNFLGCEPFLVNFTNLSTNSVKCVWDFGDGTTADNCGTVSHTYQNAGVYDVTLTATSIDNCEATFTEMGYITVTPMPVASFSFTPSETDVSHTEIEFTNSSLDADFYEWNFGDLTALSNETDPIHMYGNEPQQYHITLLATNNNGACRDSIDAYLTVNDILLYYVPNVFTPDKDAFNETFKPIFTSGYDIYKYHLMIFNRWGELIFESYNADIGWDGTYPEDGTLCQDGVYVWKIDFKETMSDKRHDVTGHVTLLK